MKTVFWSLTVFGFFLAAPAFGQVAIDDEFAREPTWKALTAAEARSQVIAWLDAAKPTEENRTQALALWPEAKDGATESTDAKPILERVATTIAIVDPAAKPIIELCAKPHGLEPTPDFAILTDEKTSAFERSNLRLYLGQWLARERRYDESLTQLGELQTADVVDPAALLFYQSVDHHWSLHKDEGLKSIAKLLEQRKTIPRRYVQLADLMQADLQALEDDSLDHIARRMNDVTRRLDFGHAGKKVRGVEDGIIASLDKLIKEMEDRTNQMNQMQQNQQQQGEQNRDGQRNGQRQRNPNDPEGIRSRSPATESRIARGRGPGEVKSKPIGNKSGWGDLPPKDREEAMQQVGKEFPSHYRDIIEQYFRKLASDEEEK
jgi:hypothetical protein